MFCDVATNSAAGHWLRWKELPKLGNYSCGPTQQERVKEKAMGGDKYLRLGNAVGTMRATLVLACRDGRDAVVGGDIKSTSILTSQVARYKVG